MPTGSVRFPNLNDHAIYRTTNLPPIDSWTVMAWCKLSVDRDANSTFWKVGGTDHLGYMCQAASGGRMLTGWNTTQSKRGTDLNVGEWYHIAQTLNGAGGGQFFTYLNGRPEIVNNGNGSLLQGQVVFGDWSITGFEPIDGCLAAIKIWDVALTGREILQEMRQYAPVKTALLNTFSPLRTLDELAINYAGMRTPWTIVGTHSEEEGPPIPFMARPRRRIYPVGLGVPVPPVAVEPAQMQWQAQAPRNDRTISVAPARVQWSVRTPTLAAAITVSPARVPWQASTSPVSRGPYGAHVQSRGAVLGNGPVRTLAYTNAVTMGNTLFVALRFGNVPGAIVVTDTLGNTYEQIIYTQGAVEFQCFYVLSSVASGANTVTITIDNIPSIRAIIAEYEGSSVLDVSSGGTGTSASLDSGNLVTTVPTTVLIGAGSTFGAKTFAPGASFTERQEVDTRLALEDRLLSSQGTYTATMGLLSSDTWAMIGAAFRQVPVQTTVVSVTPAEMAWAAQIAPFDVIKTIAPAQMAWFAGSVPLPNTIVTAPAQVVWQASAQSATRGPYGFHHQSAAGGVGTGPVGSVAFPNPVQRGNTLFVAVRFGNVPGTITVTDTLGNTYEQIAYTAGALEFECFYVLSCIASGANTVTITIDTTANIRFIIAEYEGSSVLHASSGATGSDTLLTSGDLVTTAQVALIVGAGGVFGEEAFEPGPGFIERQEFLQRLALEDRIVTSPDTYVADMTLDFSEVWTMIGAVFTPEYTVIIHPAQMPWQAGTIRSPIQRPIAPASMPWRAQALMVRQLPSPVTTVTAVMRRLVQPRVRYAPIVSLNQYQARRQQLVLWYMAQPWQFPGQQWLDMIAGTMGTFLNIPANDGLAGWQAETHPGGRGAMGFDGSARAIQVPADPAHSDLRQVTVSAWIYPRSFGTTGKARIFDKTGIAASGGFYLGVNTFEGAARAVEFGVDGKKLMIALSANNVIDVHTWTHIAVVWTGSFLRSDVQLYLNGEQVGIQTGSVGQDGQAPMNEDAGNPLYLGNRDALDRGFDGLLNDIRLYTRQLVSSEVYTLYKDSLTGSFALLQRPRFPLMLTPVVALPDFLVSVAPVQMVWRAQARRVPSFYPFRQYVWRRWRY